MSGLDNDPPAGYVTPPFPSLYWLIGPRGKVKPIYLYNTSDVWRFTLFWTLIVFEAAHLAVGFYAVTVVWWGGRNQRVGLGMGRKKGLATGGEDSSGGRGEEKQKGEPAQGSQAGVKNTGISGMWAVPVFYGLIAGVEGVFAGSVVGLLLGALYDAGGFEMSTWIPFVWSLVSLLVLIVSSFSIQGGL